MILLLFREQQVIPLYDIWLLSSHNVQFLFVVSTWPKYLSIYCLLFLLLSRVCKQSITFGLTTWTTLIAESYQEFLFLSWSIDAFRCGAIFESYIDIFNLLDPLWFGNRLGNYFFFIFALLEHIIILCFQFVISKIQ